MQHVIAIVVVHTSAYAFTRNTNDSKAVSYNGRQGKASNDKAMQAHQAVSIKLCCVKQQTILLPLEAIPVSDGMQQDVSVTQIKAGECLCALAFV